MIKQNLGYIISIIVLIVCLVLLLNKISQNNLQNNTSSSSTIRSEEDSKKIEEAPTHKKTHTIQKGDTLWDLSVKYYGDGTKYHEIIKKNPGKTFKFANGNEGLIYPGTELEL